MSYDGEGAEVGLDNNGVSLEEETFINQRFYNPVGLSCSAGSPH